MAQELLDRLQQGDETAAGELLDRYASRLIALAMSRIHGRLQRRFDAEDVVQSALGSFFRRVSEGAYEVDDEHGLWPLLATITINKLRKRIDFHGAGKRALDAEESIFTGGSAVTFVPAALVEEPGHEDEVALIEELDVVFAKLSSLHREIVMRSLAGDSSLVVAEDVNRTERTVRRVLERFRTMLRERLR